MLSDLYGTRTKLNCSPHTTLSKPLLLPRRWTRASSSASSSCHTVNSRTHTHTHTALTLCLLVALCSDRLDLEGRWRRERFSRGNELFKLVDCDKEFARRYTEERCKGRASYAGENLVWPARPIPLFCFLMLRFMVEGKGLATLAAFLVLLHITTNPNVV